MDVTREIYQHGESKEHQAMSHCRQEVGRGKCCCNCTRHLPDLSHPCTDGVQINQHRGWVCVRPSAKGVYSGWAEHGICAEHEFKTPRLATSMVIWIKPVELQTTE